MIYEPAIHNDWIWQRVDTLLSCDPVLNVWLRYQVAYTQKYAKLYIGLKLDHYYFPVYHMPRFYPYMLQSSPFVNAITFG